MYDVYASQSSDSYNTHETEIRRQTDKTLQFDNPDSKRAFAYPGN